MPKQKFMIINTITTTTEKQREKEKKKTEPTTEQIKT